MVTNSIRVELTRDIQDDRASQGVLHIFDGDNVVLKLYTLENPWLDNQRNISCIPAGEYLCRRVISPTYGETFEIMDVEGRTHILFHWGNWVKNTDGCVLLGQRDDEVPAVWNSKAAHTEFMEEFEGVDEFRLSIIEEAA